MAAPGPLRGVHFLSVVMSSASEESAGEPGPRRGRNNDPPPRLLPFSSPNVVRKLSFTRYQPVHVITYALEYDGDVEPQYEIIVRHTHEEITT